MTIICAPSLPVIITAFLIRDNRFQWSKQFLLSRLNSTKYTKKLSRVDGHCCGHHCCVAAGGGGGLHSPRPHRWLRGCTAAVTIVIVITGGGGGFHGPRPRCRWWPP